MTLIKLDTAARSLDLDNLQMSLEKSEFYNSPEKLVTVYQIEKNGSHGRIDYVPLLNGEVGYRKEFQTSKEYSFIYVGGQHLARVNGAIGGDGKKFYYHNDHQGSALAVTDENGNKIVERDFAPFGERINTDIYDETSRDVEGDDSGFTGKDWDQDVELYYYNARWYDSEIGRFTTEDSVADDPNLYGYCGQNPVNMIDPTGHIGLNITGGLMGVATSAIPGLGTVTGVVSLSSALFVGDSKNEGTETPASDVEAQKDAAQNNQSAKDPVDNVDKKDETGTGNGVYKKYKFYYY